MPQDLNKGEKGISGSGGCGYRLYPSTEERWGCKKKEEKQPDIGDRIEKIISLHKAGSPTDPGVKWTHLKPSDIARAYEAEWSEKLSNQTVKRILKSLGYRKRRPAKQLITGKSPYRQEQFKLIFYFVHLFTLMGNNPILSADTKKKEKLGDLSRAGKVLCKQAPRTYDHDYTHLAGGKVVPGGLYDMKRNEGYVSIGTNYETAAFIADNLIWWWDNYGIHHYPDVTHLLLFCDCGGANGYRHHAFKKELQRVARYIGIRIVVVHYPPYCSKWNPIEHRLFSQMHLQARGCVFHSHQQVKDIFQTTSTKTGLKVFVRINPKIYQIKLGIKKKHVDQKRILVHPELPQFNYTILP